MKRVFSFATLTVGGDSVDLRDLSDLYECFDIKLAFGTKGVDVFGEINLDLAYQECSRSTIDQDVEPAFAACRLAALRYIAFKMPVFSLNKPTIPQVIELLERIPSALKRRPFEQKPKTTTSTAQKWDFQNEYHVQSLVYSILAPIFQDIEDEFYLEPVGQLNPRADIGLPSLNLIIEIKFLRANGTFNNITEQVAADANFYFEKDSVLKKKYSNMMVLLWDNSSRSQQHQELKKESLRFQTLWAR